MERFPLQGNLRQWELQLRIVQPDGPAAIFGIPGFDYVAAILLENRPDCYLVSPKHNWPNRYNAVFEGEFGCKDGLQSGTGKAVFRPEEDGEGAEEWSGRYVVGRPHGAFVIVREAGESAFGRGYRDEANYANGELDGQRVTRDLRGRPLVGSTCVDGKVTDIRLPSAQPLPTAVLEGGGAAITGAFGIEFGTIDLGSLPSWRVSPTASAETEADLLDDSKTRYARCMGKLV